MSINAVPPRTICQLNPLYPLIVNNVNVISTTSNVPSISNTSFSSAGDSLLNGIIFTKLNSTNAPTLINRSIGTLQVFGTPTVSSTLLDNAIGVSSNSLWISGSQNITFYSDSNTSPVLIVGGNKITASTVATNTTLDGTLTNFSIHSLGDVLFDSNLIFSNTKTEPSIGTRALGTRFVFSQRNVNTNYENATGIGITNGMWLTSETYYSIFCGTGIQTRFTPTTTINFTTTKNSTLVFDPSINNTVSQYISGDLGMNSNTILFLSPTSTTPSPTTRTNGTSVVFNNKNTFGLQSNGIYMTTSNSFDVYKDSGSSLQKISSIGVISQVLDVTSNSLVTINPSIGDILGKKSVVLNSIPTTPTVITGMNFDPSKTAFFSIYINVIVALTTNSVINAVYKIDGAIIGTDTVYTLQSENYFDQLNQLTLTWGCASGGQLNVQSTNISDFSSMTILFRAVTL
jgi:hypothetical protein